MKSRIQMFLSVVVLIGAFVARANAVVINFEDIAAAPGTDFIEANETSAGFFFTSPSNHIHRDNAGSNSSFADNGSTYLLIHDNGGQNPNNALTMATVSGATFSINGLDLSEGFLGFGADSVHVLGNLFGGGTISTDFVLDGIIDGNGPLNDFEHVSFGAGWTNLTSVTFSGVAGTVNEHAFAVDNIEVDRANVPEPSLVLLLGIGLAGLGVYKRKRA